jgi:hypothetical protein
MAKQPYIIPKMYIIQFIAIQKSNKKVFFEKMTSELVKNYGRDGFKGEKMLKGNKQK